MTVFFASERQYFFASECVYFLAAEECRNIAVRCFSRQTPDPFNRFAQRVYAVGAGNPDVFFHFDEKQNDRCIEFRACHCFQASPARMFDRIVIERSSDAFGPWEPVGLRESKRIMSWSRAEFHDFQANSCSIRAGKRGGTPRRKSPWGGCTSQVILQPILPKSDRLPVVANDTGQ